MHVVAALWLGLLSSGPPPHHREAAPSFPTFGRRAVLATIAAAALPRVAHSELPTTTLLSSEEDTFTPPAGLARLKATVEQAAELVEQAELDKLFELIRSPVMVSFLGYNPVGLASSEAEEKLSEERQLKLIFTFPEASRRSAANDLGALLSEVRTLDRACVDSRAQRREIDLGRLSKCVEEARGRTEAMTKLYFAAGCMVCTEPVRSVIASDATWENPGLAVIDQFETRLNQRPERTAEEEKYAKRLGFRPD